MPESSSSTKSASLLTVSFAEGRRFLCVRVDKGQSDNEPPVHNYIRVKRALEPPPNVKVTINQNNTVCDYYCGKAYTFRYSYDISCADSHGPDEPFIPPHFLPKALFVKWATDANSQRAAGLARQAEDITNYDDYSFCDRRSGRRPIFYGHYISLNNDNESETPFSISLFEYVHRDGSR